jgi:methionine-rich copper-binding protein CopC
MKLSKIVLVATVLVSIQAFAQNTPVIDKHQARQQNRIAQGQASGQLTAKESASLQRGQAHVANKKAAAMADGKITKSERADIRQAQQRQNNRIYNKKHN